MFSACRCIINVFCQSHLHYWIIRVFSQSHVHYWIIRVFSQSHVHLTNYSLNKTHENFVDAVEGAFFNIALIFKWIIQAELLTYCLLELLPAFMCRHCFHFFDGVRYFSLTSFSFSPFSMPLSLPILLLPPFFFNVSFVLKI